MLMLLCYVFLEKFCFLIAKLLTVSVQIWYNQLSNYILTSKNPVINIIKIKEELE